MRRAASLAVAVLLMGSPTGAGAQGGDQELTLRHGGTVRSYLLHVPAAAARAPALVLVFHGGFGTGRSMVVLTGFNALADRHGFLVAYPDGTDRHWADGRETTPPDRQGVDDVGFVSALVDHLIQAKGVDPRRVFATGISNGGIFSHRLGCSLAGKIAAIGPIAGTMAEPLVPRCQPRQAVSVIAFHGTEDSFVPWAGGEVRGPIRGRVLSVASTTARWAALNRCPAAPARAAEPERAPTDGTRVRRETYAPCLNGTAVVLYAIEGAATPGPEGRKDEWRPRGGSAGRSTRRISSGSSSWIIPGAEERARHRACAV